MTSDLQLAPQSSSKKFSSIDRRRQAGEAVLAGVDKAINSRWQPAKDRAARLTGDTIDEKVKALTSTYARELGTVGGAAGAVAAVPGVGTSAAIAGSVADFGYFAFRAGELILTIGAVHGHEDATIEEQRAAILSVLAYGNGASEAFRKLAGEVGKGLGKKAALRIPASSLQAINATLGRTIVTRYGTRRGVIALGRVMPMGIGMVIGGGANYGTTKLLGRYAHKFFSELPYATTNPSTDAQPDQTEDQG